MWYSVDKGTCPSRDIPGTGGLDLNNLRTQTSQKLGTKGSSDILAEIQNAYIS
jgi:hypothetical protein